MCNVEITVERLRLLRIKIFTDYLCKLILTITRGSLTALGNTKCSQNLAKQANAKINML